MVASTGIQPAGKKRCITRYKDCAAADADQPDNSSLLQFKAKAEMFHFFANLYAV